MKTETDFVKDLKTILGELKLPSDLGSEDYYDWLDDEKVEDKLDYFTGKLGDIAPFDVVHDKILDMDEQQMAAYERIMIHIVYIADRLKRWPSEYVLVSSLSIAIKLWHIRRIRKHNLLMSYAKAGVQESINKLMLVLKVCDESGYLDFQNRRYSRSRNNKEFQEAYQLVNEIIDGLTKILKEQASETLKQQDDLPSYGIAPPPKQEPEVEPKIPEDIVPEYPTFESLFKTPAYAALCLKVLREVDPPVINIENEFLLGDEKGVFAVLCSVLKTRAALKTYEVKNLVRVFNQTFEGLKLYKDGKSLNEPGKRATEKYQSAFISMLPSASN